MKKNLFDTMKKTAMFDNIDESTVLEKTGASSERIISGVMEQIKTKEGKTMKKHFTKRTAIYLTAAAILTAAVCSVPAIANSIHSKNKVFDGYTDVIHLEDAKDIKITTGDENLQVDNVVLGGDNTRAVVEVTLSKKDGSAFAEKEYLTGDLADNMEVGDIYFAADNNKDISVTNEYQDNFVFENDNKNVKITLIGYYDNDDSGLFAKGAETIVKCDNFYAYTVDEVLKSYPQNMTSEELQDMYSFRDETADTLSPLSQQGLYISYTGTEYQVFKGKRKTIDIPFEISLTLDYENNTNEKTIPLDEQTIGNGTVTVTPYGMDFQLDTQQENSKAMNQYAVITMKDGKNYYTDSIIKIQNTDSATAYTQLYTPHEPKSYLGEEIFDTSVYIIDTNEISTISMNGVTIYTAE